MNERQRRELATTRIRLADFIWALLGMLALFILFALFTGAAHGQTLESVGASSGGGLWPIVIIGALALIGGGLVVWHKRNPTSYDKALRDALARSTELAHSASSAARAAVTHAVADAPTVPAPDVTPTAPADPPFSGGATVSLTFTGSSIEQAEAALMRYRVR